MMPFLRGLIRFPLIFLCLGGFMLVARIGSRFLRDEPSRYRWRGAVTRRLAATLLRILGIRVEVTGRPPAEPFLLVSNHLGYLDIVVLETLIPVFFISKADVAGWPFVGWVVKSTNTLFVTRENRRDLARVNDLIESTLDSGRSVIFFPEGTSSSGENVLAFKPSLLEVPARREWPVHTAAIRYQGHPGDPPAHLTMAWWGGMEFFPHLKALCRLRGGRAHVHFNPDPVVGSDRKRLANRAHDAVSSSFTPTMVKETA